MRRRPWTPEEDQCLCDLYPHRATVEVAHALGRTACAVYQHAINLGLRKSAEYLDSLSACRLRRIDNIGKAHRFPKGHTPWNDGLKGWQPNGRNRETQFKPGNMPQTHVPVGTVVKSTDGYWKIKIAEPKQWKWLHRYNWEQANGPIPRGLCLVFRDGNVDNCAVENLELITRRDLVKRNSFHRFPAELKAAIRVANKLKRTVEALHEEQN